MLHDWAHTYLLNKQSEGDADAVQYMFDMDECKARYSTAGEEAS